MEASDHCHPDAVRSLASMEAVAGASSWNEMPKVARSRFQAKRSPQGEQLVLAHNAF